MPLLPESPGWTNWHPTMRATLLFIFHEGKVLLIRKKRGLGAGKINGPGGKIEPGESPVACAIRETQEELGVTALAPQELGILRFRFTDGLALECHVFRSDAHTGSAIETDEAVPLWTPVDAIPIEEMWADDRFWLPHLINKQPFAGWFEFDGDTMLTRCVETLREQS